MYIYDNIDIFVNCSGKSGGCTLYDTFILDNYKTIRSHNNYEFKYNNSNNISLFDVINMNNNKNIYIIDSYRNPIERKISSFFENINSYLPNYNKLSVEEIINFFNDNNFIYNLEEYHSINEIFDHYNMPRFNNFNFDTKYNIFKKDNKIFIKIRFNDIKDWSNILSKIFNKNIIIQNSNLSINKVYFNIYNQFIEKYKVPMKFLEENLSNDMEFKIYNSRDEQEDYFNKWIIKSC